MKKLLKVVAVIVFLIAAILYKFYDPRDSDINETTSRYFGNEVKGDFNGDSQEDVAYLFTQDGGGSGTFYYLGVKLADGKYFKEADPVLLGDRIAPQTTEFREGLIVVNYAERKPSEPMTTKPSVGVSAYFKVIENELVKVK